MGTKSNKAAGVGAVAGGAAGGIAGAAAAGAAIGGITGPVGAAAGALAGAAIGGLAGKGVGIADPVVDPSAEEAYWREHYQSQPYAGGASYDDYGPAYRHGIEGHHRHPGRSFDEIEPALERDWPNARGHSTLDWARARHASRDAWQRMSGTQASAVPDKP